jgi:hypothetical protein
MLQYFSDSENCLLVVPPVTMRVGGYRASMMTLCSSRYGWYYPVLSSRGSLDSQVVEPFAMSRLCDHELNTFSGNIWVFGYAMCQCGTDIQYLNVPLSSDLIGGMKENKGGRIFGKLGKKSSSNHPNTQFLRSV